MRIYNSRKDFNINGVNEISTIESDINSNITEQPSTPCAAKRKFIDIKCESLTDVPSLKKIDLKKDSDVIGSYLVEVTDPIPLVVMSPKIEIKLEEFNEEIAITPHISNTEQVDDVSLAVMSSDIEIDNSYEPETFTEKIATTSSQSTICKKSKQCVMKKNLMLRSYHRSNMFSLEFNSSIYKDAIKKIDIIDSKGSFVNIVLKEVNNLIGERGGEISSLNLSKTYSNVCKYILHKISPYLDDIMSTADVPITPGMSISNIKYNCVLNHLFFEKLSEICENTIKDIRVSSDDSLLNVFQSYVNFDNCPATFSGKYKFFTSSKNRDIFCSKLKELIIETIYNLPRSIIWEIENFDQSDIVSGLFSDVHGVLLSKSSIRDLKCFFDSIKNEISSSNFEDNFDLFSNLLKKIEYLVRRSCMLYKGEVCLPDKFVVEKLSKYLLSDMYGISVNFGEKAKLSSQNTSGLQGSSYRANVGIRSPKLYLSTMSPPTEINQEHNYCNTVQVYITSKELKLRKYKNINSLWYKKFTGSIYEDAIQKVDIDSSGLFKNSVLKVVDNSIKNRGLSGASIDLSLTYSNVRKYVLDKISPYINSILAVEDVLITSGMSISEIKSSCISNHYFFEKLREICEKIVEGISIIAENVFLNIIQTRVRLGSDSIVNIVSKRSRLCKVVKEIIIETISNLPRSIIFEIGKFEQSDIVNGLFLDVYGVLMSKSLIRKIKSLLNYEKNKFPNDNFENNVDLFNNMFAELRNMVKKSVILHEGKILLPDESVTDVLSRHLLLDMHDSPFKFYKNLKLSAKSGSDINESSKSISFESFNSVTDNFTNAEIQSLKNEEFIPKVNSKWNPSLITFLNVYELATSMIDIDKGEFECYFLDEMKLISPMVARINDESKIKLNLSVTYDRVKKYISDLLLTFFKENETKAEIELYHGMSLDELEFAYISNERFFTKLRSFCNEVTTHIRNHTDTLLIDMVQSVVRLETESVSPKIIKKIHVRKYKCNFNKCMSELLVNNIYILPEKIASAIVLLPRSKLIGEYFSSFYNIYVDNKSLLKVKSVFDAAKKKIVNDKLLSKLVNKISSDMVDEFGKDIIQNVSKFINSYIVCEVSTITYIRKLVRNEFSTLRYNPGNPIITIRHDKVEIAEPKIKCEILDKLEYDLIVTSTKLYVNLCINQYRSKIKSDVCFAKNL